jgi:hypothetical protein
VLFLYGGLTVLVPSQTPPNSSCSVCPPATGLQNGTCVPCGPGDRSYTNGTCALCGAGKIPANEGTYCEFCPPGTEPLRNQTQCVGCPLSMKSSLDGNCERCTADGMVPDSTQSLCTYCPPGQEPDALGTKCIGCTAGQFSNLEGSCQPCGSSQLNVTSNVTWWDKGAMVPNKERTVCQYCPPGQEPDATMHACVGCRAGQYSDLDKCCKNCPPDKIPTQDQTSCQHCSSGSVPSLNGSTCQACPPGSDTHGSQQVHCMQCEAGWFSLRAGEQCGQVR